METEVFGENLPQCRFVHHEPRHVAPTRTRAAAVGSQRLTALATARLDQSVTDRKMHFSYWNHAQNCGFHDNIRHENVLLAHY
jgi:hypothetical protein